MVSHPSCLTSSPSIHFLLVLLPSTSLPLPLHSPAPSAPPQEVHLLSLSSTSIQVSWTAPPAASRHGNIVRYSLAYQASSGEDTERHEVPDIPADATSHTLAALEKWTEYQVWVRAHTDVGPGPESPAARIKTKEDGTAPSTHFTVYLLQPSVSLLPLPLPLQKTNPQSSLWLSTDLPSAWLLSVLLVLPPLLLLLLLPLLHPPLPAACSAENTNSL